MTPTPEERTKNLFTMAKTWNVSAAFLSEHAFLLEHITDAIREAEADARREEREACAALAAGYPADRHGHLKVSPFEAAGQAAEEIAAAIRAREEG